MNGGVIASALKNCAQPEARHGRNNWSMKHAASKAEANQSNINHRNVFRGRLLSSTE